MEDPEIVLAVHRDYLEAGAGVLCINTYTATLPLRLARNGAPPEWFDEAQALALSIVDQARRESGRTDVQLERLSASARCQLSDRFQHGL